MSDITTAQLKLISTQLELIEKRLEELTICTKAVKEQNKYLLTIIINTMVTIENYHQTMANLDYGKENGVFSEKEYLVKKTEISNKYVDYTENLVSSIKDLIKKPKEKEDNKLNNTDE